jgi:hypothetical protein
MLKIIGFFNQPAGQQQTAVVGVFVENVKIDAFRHKPEN